MKTIQTVFKKELLDILRDKRTLFITIFLPMFLIPILIFGMIELQKTFINKENNKKLKIAVLHVPKEFDTIFEDANFELIPNVSVEEGKQEIAEGRMDAIVVFETNFSEEVQGFKTGRISLFYKSTNLSIHKRISEKLAVLKTQLLEERIAKLNISKTTLNPIAISTIDVATANERIGKTVGGFLPYVFIIFSFMGCMYPAIELITGEKERGTMETLLTVRASRLHILLGKISAISTVGMVSALMIVLGLLVGVKFIPNIPKEFLTSLNDILSVKFIVLLFLMLLPLNVFIASFITTIIAKAKSYKEAQSTVTPFTFLFILPAMIALSPSIELSWKTAFIPVLNIALTTKEIIGGTLEVKYFIITFLSLITLALVSAYISYKQFSDENKILG